MTHPVESEVGDGELAKVTAAVRCPRRRRWPLAAFRAPTGGTYDEPVSPFLANTLTVLSGRSSFGFVAHYLILAIVLAVPSACALRNVRLLYAHGPDMSRVPWSVRRLQ